MPSLARAFFFCWSGFELTLSGRLFLRSDCGRDSSGGLVLGCIRHVKDSFGEQKLNEQMGFEDNGPVFMWNKLGAGR